MVSNAVEVISLRGENLHSEWGMLIEKEHGFFRRRRAIESKAIHRRPVPGRASGSVSANFPPIPRNVGVILNTYEQRTACVVPEHQKTESPET